MCTHFPSNSRFTMSRRGEEHRHLRLELPDLIAPVGEPAGIESIPLARLRRLLRRVVLNLEDTYREAAVRRAHVVDGEPVPQCGRGLNTVAERLCHGVPDEEDTGRGARRGAASVAVSLGPAGAATALCPAAGATARPDELDTASVPTNATMATRPTAAGVTSRPIRPRVRFPRRTGSSEQVVRGRRHGQGDRHAEDEELAAPETRPGGIDPQEYREVPEIDAVADGTQPDQRPPRKVSPKDRSGDDEDRHQYRGRPERGDEKASLVQEALGAPQVCPQDGIEGESRHSEQEKGKALAHAEARRASPSVRTKRARRRGRRRAGSTALACRSHSRDGFRWRRG